MRNIDYESNRWAANLHMALTGWVSLFQAFWTVDGGRKERVHLAHSAALKSGVGGEEQPDLLV